MAGGGLAEKSTSGWEAGCMGLVITGGKGKTEAAGGTEGAARGGGEAAAGELPGEEGACGEGVCWTATGLAGAVVVGLGLDLAG